MGEVRSAITVSLTAEARQGPFVYHDGLEDAMRRASALGFDAIEIFPPEAAALDVKTIQQLLSTHNLKLAAVGTGAGWLRKQLSLVAEDAAVREAAAEFIREIIDVAGALGAPAIVGSMQGRAASLADKADTLELLGQMLVPLAEYAAQKYSVPLLIEPLNRYETNLLNDLVSTAAWMESLATDNLKILADLFHMNIEEADMAESIMAAGSAIGHVHFADSNRKAVGLGHSPIEPAIQSLMKIGYNGYLSAEIFPRPDVDRAAQATITSFKRLTGVK